MGKKRLLLKTVVLIALCLLLSVIAYIPFHLITLSAEAERTLVSVGLTCHVVEQYLDEHEGAWPRSWKDLESVHLSSDDEDLALPNGLNDLRASVYIDFDVSADDLLRARRAEDFRAIRPIRPCYESYHKYFWRLIQKLRAWQEKRQVKGRGQKGGDKDRKGQRGHS
jgi:hypothetical protein